MTPSNLLIILSDEHSPGVIGAHGHPEIRTPHIDKLISGGTDFTSAICASPICVPTRAAIATGRYCFEMGYWDNVDGYDGRTPSWHHVLRDAGHEVSSIGKLHYRGWEGDDYGFTESLLPMHIHQGRGEVKMLLRDPPASIGDGSNMLRSAKAGESDYTRYDRQIALEAKRWLRDHGSRCTPAKPWVLMVSMVAPHFPLTAPEEFFDWYKERPLAMPKDYRFGVEGHPHPFLTQYAQLSGYNRHFESEDDVRRALCGYYGLVSFLDHQIGDLLETVQDAGLADNTRVLYLSDHGDNMGSRGLWGKSTMYRESVGIPLVLSGPEVEKGRTVSAPTTQIDVYNTVLDAVGIPLATSTASTHSRSLLRPIEAQRTTLAEYHTVGSRSAIFMLQDAHAKYVHYEDLAPQLFDLENDPQELHDMALQPGRKPQLQDWERLLHSFCDPGVIDLKAKQRQAELIALFGGEEAIRSGQGIGGYTPSPLK